MNLCVSYLPSTSRLLVTHFRRSFIFLFMFAAHCPATNYSMNINHQKTNPKVSNKKNKIKENGRISVVSLDL